MNTEQKLTTRSERTETGCLEWQGARQKSGGNYGLVMDGDTLRKTHRVAYELWVGPIPEGMWVLHRCDNPPCIEPTHLFLGNASDNARDAFNKGRRKTPNPKGKPRPELYKTHCKRGHPLKPRERCKPCHAMLERERRRARRLANPS